MIRSMTGFGAGRAPHQGEEIDVEVRSVNHKFCEVKVRLPRELAPLEHEVVRAVKSRLARGGVDVSVRRGQGRTTLAPRVDLDLAREYARAFEALQAQLGLPGSLSVADVLQAEGVVRLEERALDVEPARAATTAALDQALAHLVAMREREGAALARDLEARLGEVESLAARIGSLAPASVEHYRTRLHERIQELARGVALDGGRLAQEVAIFADRMDVSEELTRLHSHVDQVRGLLAGEEPAGRKMEFLVQEMHREANTIGSKSQSSAIAAAVVSLKAEVERMREQVQNVE
jgi:uncharacterized protein (TIGR00255 family)